MRLKEFFGEGVVGLGSDCRFFLFFWVEVLVGGCVFWELGFLCLGRCLLFVVWLVFCVGWFVGLGVSVMG